MPIQQGKLSGIQGGPINPTGAISMNVQAEIERARMIERSYGQIGKGMAAGAANLVTPWLQAKRDERLHKFRMDEAGGEARAKAEMEQRKAQAKAAGAAAVNTATILLASDGTPGINKAKLSPLRAANAVSTREQVSERYQAGRSPEDAGVIDQRMKDLARTREVRWFNPRELEGFMNQVALTAANKAGLKVQGIDEIPPDMLAEIQGAVSKRLEGYPTSIEEAAVPLQEEWGKAVSRSFGTAVPAMQQRQDVPYGPVGGTPGATEPYVVTSDLLDKLDMDAIFPGGVPGATYGDRARQAILEPDPQTGGPTVFDPESGLFQGSSQFHRRLEEVVREGTPLGTDTREAFGLAAAQPGWKTSKSEMRNIGKQPEARKGLVKPLPPLPTRPGEPTGPASGFLRRDTKGKGKGVEPKGPTGLNSLKYYIEQARGGG